jgi:uroporphyrinogen-III synthase
MNTFQNTKIAILEARMSNEMAGLITRYGGIPCVAPAVCEVRRNSQREVAAFLEHLLAGSIHAVIFFTGVGASTLFQEAERLARLPELLHALREVMIICRGPKPTAVLKRYEIPIALNAREPYTTTELLALLQPLDMRERGVAVIHYGERNAALIQTLREKGAHVEELCLYEWLLPEDIGPLQTLVHEIIARRIDAVVFTSQVQARHLFQVAADLGLADALARALNTGTIVASVGPTCTGALQSYGVTPHVVPEHPKMGHLIKALFDYATAPR